jgi:hypothetical protein
LRTQSRKLTTALFGILLQDIRYVAELGFRRPNSPADLRSREQEFGEPLISFSAVASARSTDSPASLFIPDDDPGAAL